MSINKRCVIVGSSHSAAQLALSTRQQGWQGEILIIGEETQLPYQRPPLSKDFLAHTKQAHELLIRPSEAYEKANIEFRLGSAVESIQRQEKKLILKNGDTIHYDKLALCTGASALKIPLPGSELQGVHYLRSLKDAQIIRDQFNPDKPVIIIGGGFIGLECAAALRALGAKVTVLEAQSRLLKRVVSPEVSEFFQILHQNKGVNVVTNTQVSQIEGEQYVTGVTCTNGQQFSAGQIIIGVGVTPNTQLALQCGLAVENGIKINEFAQTSDPDIVAAGDCCSFYHSLYKKEIRLESIQNAMDQAKAAAASVCGKEAAFNQTIPRFWSDQYQFKLQIIGLSQGYDKIVIQGGITHQENFAAFYLKDNKLISASVVNMPKLIMKAQQMIQSQKIVSEEDLKDMFHSLIPKNAVTNTAK